MIKQENYFYIINDQFFEDFPDPYLKRNHQGNRPHYFAFKEENQTIFWIIPISSINGILLKLVHENDIRQIRKKANKIYNLISRRIRFSPTQPKVLEIRDEPLYIINFHEGISSQEIAATKDDS